MSGIEIVGLVLGAIPLVISGKSTRGLVAVNLEAFTTFAHGAKANANSTGLEHYGEGVKTIKSMFNYPQEFATLSRRLRIENGIFKNAIELLLHDAVDDTTALLLLEQPAGKRWHDPNVKNGLQEKMQSSYIVFMETIESMNRTITEFQQRLRLGPDGKVRESSHMPVEEDLLTDDYRVHFTIVARSRKRTTGSDSA